MKFSTKSSKDNWDCWIDETHKTSIEFSDGHEISSSYSELFGAGIRYFSDRKVGFAATTQADNLVDTFEIAKHLSKYGQNDIFNEGTCHPENIRHNPVPSPQIQMEDIKNYLYSLIELLATPVSTKIYFEAINKDIKYQSNFYKLLEGKKNFYQLKFTKIFTERGKQTSLKNIFASFPKDHKRLHDSLSLFYLNLPEGNISAGEKLNCLMIEQASTFLLRLLARTLLTLFKVITSHKMYQNMQKQLVLNQQLHVLDLPFAKDSVFGLEFDGEGNICQARSIIENGKFENAIFNNKFGAIIGVKSTGNAVRHFSRPPYLDFRNFVMENGKRSYKEILSEISEGLLILEMKDTHFSSKFGEYQVEIVHGLKIINGKLEQRIFDGRFVINVFEIFGNKLLEIGKEYFKDMNVHSVPILIDKIIFL